MASRARRVASSAEPATVTPMWSTSARRAACKTGPGICSLSCSATNVASTDVGLFLQIRRELVVLEVLRHQAVLLGEALPVVGFDHLREVVLELLHSVCL